ncbi:MAG: DEAD/DEAH box helicase, partial [candidate division Zixibacteria bacterium]|nr:DEAD/DEAH box helicase [candidate division Zixibacteria bacterium]
LSMGFYPDMKQVQRYLPRRQINGYMFSATFPRHVLRLANEFLYRPELLSLSRDHVHVTETEHLYYIVPPMEKDRCLVRIIEMENPHSAIIFCNTKVTVQYVSAVLQRFGYDADQLSADLTQKQRDKVMNRVRKGTLRFLVATDVAARGIDIPDLSHVFLYEPPQDVELYIHRAGRTGRAGASGQAISLVAKSEVSEIRKIGERYSIEFIERPLPDDADVAALVSQRVIALLEARLRDRDKLQTERMQRFVPLARALAEFEHETAVIAMLVDDYYQETLHGKPDTPPTEAPPDKKPAGNGRRQSGSAGKRGRSDRTRKR